MRYRALILDHDDTAVDSTATVHYPAHLRSMALLRPGQPTVSLETWFLKNFHPGIMGFLQDELGMDARELAVEEEVWRAGMASETPRFYEGFLDALARFQAQGGHVSVVSHSAQEVILRHYQEAGVRLEPGLVFGWEAEPERRKPSPYPVLEVLRRLGVAPGEALVVDDLKPGVQMARAAGVAVAAAGWAHAIPDIRAFMEANCVAYFERVADFAEFILV
jgi:phosphoglycolate phosphatase/pyrophosphatase PpaX